MTVSAQSYPQGFISETLRKSAWSPQDLGLYLNEGVSSDWNQIMQSVAAQFSEDQRLELISVLQSQMGENLSQSQKSNLRRLQENSTYFVVTGQQIHLGLGPMYVIYKICSAIVLCNDLNQRYTDNHFVPLFWMATEDHDVEEINHVDLFGQRFTCDIQWKTGVGTLPTQGFDELWHWMRQKFERNEDALERLEHCMAFYHGEGRNLSMATAHWVSEFFADFGLLILDPSEARLKKRAKSIFAKDLFENTFLEAFSAQSDILKLHDIEPPAHFRACNVFWMDADRRERVVKQGNDFGLVDSNRKITRAEMQTILEAEPERISPNVLLRPLYQQAILPAVAYVAGPTEYLYWLQTTQAFVKSGIAPPALIHRMGGIVINATQQKKLNQIDVKPHELFNDASDLRTMLVQRLSGDNALQSAQAKIEEGIKEYLEVLYQWKNGSLVDVKKQSESFLKSQRKSTDEAINQYLSSKFSEASWNSITHLQNDTFSLKNPQERRLNFIQYYLEGKTQWLSEICHFSAYSPEQAFWYITLD